MEHPYGEQYSQEGNPRAYMTMRDYRNLPYQWGNQQPVGRNPNPPRSIREYRDQWMSAPVYSVPSTYAPPPQYDHPKLPFYASTPQSPQSQQPPPLSLVEQAILNLSKQVDNFIEDNRVVNVQANRETETVKSSLNKSTDGLQSEMELKLDNLQCSILKLAQQLDHSEEESQEDECLTETILGEQVQLQPQEELKVESLEAPEELQEALESSVAICLWEEKEATFPLTEKSSGHETVEGTQESIIQPNPIDLDSNAIAQPKNNPLLVPPSADLVYIQPPPTANSKPTAPKAKSNPLPAAPPDSVFILPMPAAQPKPQASTTKATPSLLVLQNIRRLVASVHAFATTSKTMAAAYMAWHSGWFGCGFGFGTPGPRHF